jgi:hypothetical protein
VIPPNNNQDMFEEKIFKKFEDNVCQQYIKEQEDLGTN